MVDVLNINDLTNHIKPIVNRGPHTTEDEVFDAFRSLGVGDFKNADLYFGGFDGNAGWERHPAGRRVGTGNRGIDRIRHHRRR